jgi:hypothetical protein
MIPAARRSAVRPSPYSTSVVAATLRCRSATGTRNLVEADRLVPSVRRDRTHSFRKSKMVATPASQQEGR